MKKINKLLIAVFFTFSIIYTGCAPEKESSGVELNYQKHTKAEDLSKLEILLRGDTVPVDPSYDLYVDFSMTMKRAVTDKVYSDLITAAIFESDEKTNCYMIGKNPELKLVTGDNATRKNTFLDATKYVETFTYLTANMNNIISNPTRPSIVFTDFSIDENKPTTDMAGVKSTFIRGPEFKGQFAEWFKSGGSIRIYGKRSSVNGQNLPIYVIAFLPRGMDNKHKSNNILSKLDASLKEIYFNFHSDYVKIEATPNDKRMSDYLNFSQSKGGYSLANGMGEVLIYDGGSLLSKLKKDAKPAAVSFFDGLAYQTDTTSYFNKPEFTLQVDEFQPKTKEKLSTELGNAPAFFGKISVGENNKFLFPMETKNAKLDKYYQTPHFFRLAIMAQATGLNFNQSAVEKDLAYEIPQGSKKLLNNCLSESLAKGLDEAVRTNPKKTLYTICAFVKKK